MLKSKSIGDTAVDGLLAGAGAGIAMVLFLILAGFLLGNSPTLVLGRFDIQVGGRPLVGLLTHIAISAIYGLIFAILFLWLSRFWPFLLRWGWLSGLVYGVLLYGIARGAFYAGTNSGLVQFAPLALLAAHLLYGLVLGLIIGRKWRHV